MRIKALYICFFLLVFSTSTALSQTDNHTSSLPDSSLDISLLLNPTLFPIDKASANSAFSSSLPLIKYSQNVPLKGLLSLTSSILKNKFRDPFNFPYFGLGIERPQYFLEPVTVTDYQLSLSQLKYYHTPSF